MKNHESDFDFAFAVGDARRYIDTARFFIQNVIPTENPVPNVLITSDAPLWSSDSPMYLPCKNRSARPDCGSKQVPKQLFVQTIHIHPQSIIDYHDWVSENEPEKMYSLRDCLNVATIETIASLHTDDPSKRSAFVHLVASQLYKNSDSSRE
jgi:hypothetical protein